ncbi:hypothetical protein FB451DRAFT_1361369, partial [Mycena latifolia]
TAAGFPPFFRHARQSSANSVDPPLVHVLHSAHCVALHVARYYRLPSPPLRDPPRAPVDPAEPTRAPCSEDGWNYPRRKIALREGPRKSPREVGAAVE